MHDMLDWTVAVRVQVTNLSKYEIEVMKLLILICLLIEIFCNIKLWKLLIMRYGIGLSAIFAYKKLKMKRNSFQIG
jgi:hypothetical protein